MTRSTGARLAAPLFATALLACGSLLEPEDWIRMTIEASPTEIAIGDTVELVAIAFNPTAEPVWATPGGCGQGLGVLAEEPGTGVILPLWGGPSLCPIFDSNVLEPGETDSVTISWWGMGVRGDWRVRAVVLIDGRPHSPSGPLTVTVR